MRRMPSNQPEQGQRLKKQIPIDKKLRLAQYIRAENMDNRMKIRQRERLLYGLDSTPYSWRKGDSMRMEESFRAGIDERNGFYPEEIPSGVSGTFRLRMAAAVILFIGFLLCDAGQYKIFGYSMNDVYGMISEDYFKLYDSENIDELPQLTELLDFNSTYH